MRNFVINAVVVLAVAVLVVAFLLNPFIKTGGEDTKGNVPGGDKAQDTITNLDLEAQLKACSILTTAQYEFSAECYYENDGFLFLTGEECTFAYKGYVNAGIEDFSEVQVRINRDNNVIEVYMPEVEILGNPVIDFSSVEVLDESTGWFSDITVEETTELFEQCCDHQLSRAIEAGILDEARDSVREVVIGLFGEFLAETEFADYKIAVVFGIEAPDEYIPQGVDAVLSKVSSKGM